MFYSTYVLAYIMQWETEIKHKISRHNIVHNAQSTTQSNCAEQQSRVMAIDLDNIVLKLYRINKLYLFMK